MRTTGTVLLLMALAVAAVDIASHGALRDVGSWWFQLHRNSLQLLQPALERHVAVWLWDPVMLTVLQWPLAVVLGASGLMLRLLSGRRRR